MKTRTVNALLDLAQQISDDTTMPAHVRESARELEQALLAEAGIDAEEIDRETIENARVQNKAERAERSEEYRKKWYEEKGLEYPGPKK